MRSDIEISQYCELICRVLDGQASVEETRQLEELLHCDPEVLELYIQIGDTAAELMCPGPSMGISYQAERGGEPGLDKHLWMQLLAEERTAPTLEMLTSEVDERLLVKPKPVSAPRRVSRFSLFSLITSAAALFFLAIFAQFGPSRPIPVATVVDCFEAQWQGSPHGTGNRLTNGRSPLRLTSGLAKLQFDNGAEVILEAPCEFQLDSAEQMRLVEGKLTAVIRPEAAGFRVNTSIMSVTDLGTEFSIRVDETGGTVNLYKGRASLLAGKEGYRKGSYVLTEGQARRVDLQTQHVEEISLDNESFVRRLDSKKDILWRGGSLCLAGVIAGGDGFASVPGIGGIDPETGKAVRGYAYRLRESTGAYQSVSDNPFVDGVFIPDGGLGQNIVSSTGHVFKECPDTVKDGSNPIGATSHDIVTFCGFDERDVTLKRFLLPVFDGVRLGDIQNPAVLLHSNSGITFDLDAIRRHLPELQIQRLVCSFGLPNQNRLTGATADVWVLLDGKTRFVKRQLVQADGRIDVSLLIDSGERFLTFAVTDAAYAAEPGDGPFNNDYVYLITPRLILAGSY